MARANDFVDPEYDRQLAAFREQKEQMKREMNAGKPAPVARQASAASSAPAASPQRREFKFR